MSCCTDQLNLPQRSSRGSRNEIPRDSGTGPSLSDPADVSGPRRIPCGVLRLAGSTREPPVQAEPNAALHYPGDPSRVPRDLRESQYLGCVTQAGA